MVVPYSLGLLSLKVADRLHTGHSLVIRVSLTLAMDHKENTEGTTMYRSCSTLEATALILNT
jgi:hypothetical protein